MKVVLDTNFFIYRAIKDSVHHEAAKELLEEVEIWVVPTIVVHELVWGLGELLGKEKALRYIKALLSHRKVEIAELSKADILWAVTMIEAEELSLARYNDKLILSVAKRKGLPLASFDKQLLKQAVRLGISIIPPYSYEH